MNLYHLTPQQPAMDSPFESMRRFSTSQSERQCVVCGSTAIGINFGVPTCAPCKAFFRRNARRKEVLSIPCQHRPIYLSDEIFSKSTEQSMQYLQIRRCSSCRLSRCFQVGMKEELVRTEEENQRHKQLVDANRKQRLATKQHQLDYLLLIPQETLTDTKLLSDSDWRHLANIVSAYETHCLKTYIQQRSTLMCIDPNSSSSPDDPLRKSPTTLCMHITLPLSSFLRSLPAFQSLSYSHRSYLCRTNIRPLILPNNHELNQSCFSEPWQIARDREAWAVLCGPDLYERFLSSEKNSQLRLIADPIITRVWLVMLFFSTSLFSYYEPISFNPKMKKSFSALDIQNGYVTLLWKYLLHRHGEDAAYRIYANLIHVFLSMISIGIGINTRLRSQADLRPTHEMLAQLISLDINHV